jgi:hypothetical protein
MNAKHTPVLKPCLICSGPVNIKAITVKKTPKTGFRYWQIICDKCNLKLESNTRDGVINLWTRAPETAAELERSNEIFRSLIANFVDEISEAEEKIDRLKAVKCRWKPSEEFDNDNWESSCGNLFSFFADGPKENGFEFCPYCGKPITIEE